MVRIDGVARESRAQRAGILPGDVLVSINGHPVADVLDYRFYETERELTLSLRRGETAYTAGKAPVRLSGPGIRLIPDGRAAGLPE